ncbi:MAG TPA: flagellar hook-length control protein FliK [Phycisphaerae bacterium]
MSVSRLLDQNKLGGFLTQAPIKPSSDQSVGWGSQDQNTGGFDEALAAARDQKSTSNNVDTAPPPKAEKPPAKPAEKKAKKSKDTQSEPTDTSDSDAAQASTASSDVESTGTKDAKSSDQKDAKSSEKTAKNDPTCTAQLPANLPPPAAAPVPLPGAASAPSPKSDMPDLAIDIKAKMQIAHVKTSLPDSKDPAAKETDQKDAAAQKSQDAVQPQDADSGVPLPDEAKAGTAEKFHKALHMEAKQVNAGDTSDVDAQKPPTPEAPQADMAAVADESQKAATIESADSQPKPTLPSGLTITSVSTDTFGMKPASDHAEVAPAAQDTQQADAADTMDQVVLGLKGKFDARAGKAEIRLDPPNLGTVRVSLSLDNGSLTAEFQSQSNLVRDLLKGNLEKLKSVLEGQGVAVDRLDVSSPPISASDAGAKGNGQQASFGSPNHDGRSAGQYQQDPRSGQRQSDGPPSQMFSRMIRQFQEAPIDLVA